MEADSDSVKCTHCLQLYHTIETCPIYSIVSNLKKVDKSHGYYYKHYDLPMYDTHCHLDYVMERFGHRDSSFQNFKESRHFPANLKGCISSFSDLAAYSTFSPWPDYVEQENIWVTFGLHPHFATAFNERIKKRMLECLEHKKAIAVGECGIDYSIRNDCAEEVQKNVFKQHIEIAKKLKKPLVIHSREAEDDVYEILCEENMYEWPIHVHCFTGSHSQLHRFVNEFSKMYFGFTNLVSYPTANDVHEVVKSIPLDRMLLETDAPYFVPQSLRDQEKFSHPGDILFVAEAIGELRNQDVEIILDNCRRNVRKLYGI